MQYRKEIAIVAGPMSFEDTRESWLARVPRKIPSINFRTTRSLFYGELPPTHWAALELRQAVELIEVGRQLERLTALQEKLAERLLVIDAHFYCKTAARFLDEVEQIRDAADARNKERES